jgi:hypothetical protein
LQLRRHRHFIANQTNAQSAALTATAAVSRESTVMRKIDQVTGCAGCGAADPWLWAWECDWA